MFSFVACKLCGCVYVGLGCQSNGCVYLILMHLLPQTQLMRITQATRERTAESEMKFHMAMTHHSVMCISVKSMFVAAYILAWYIVRLELFIQ